MKKRGDVMAVTISNSPVHSDAIISYPYGVTDSGYSCGWHTGVDIIPYGDTENNPWLYPVKPRSCCLCKYDNNSSPTEYNVKY